MASAEVFSHGFAQRPEPMPWTIRTSARLVRKQCRKFFELAERVGRAHPDQVQLVTLASFDAEGDGRRFIGAGDVGGARSRPAPGARARLRS